MKIIFLLIFSFAFFSCSKKDTNYLSICVSGNDVYIVGDYNNEAFLWKNGEKVQLDSVKGTNSYATSVFISGNDVYVAGCVNDKPVIWKNSKFKQIDNSANFSRVSDAFVSGTDVYLVGTAQYGNTKRENGELVYDNENSAVLWKNDKKIILAKCHSCVPTSIAVSGIDVYVGGAVGPTGVIWKRDSAIIAESDKATFIDVIGETTATNTSVNIGVALDSNMLLSKSTDKFDVDIEHIYDIYVSESDIYAIGQDVKSNMFVFKNGINIQKESGVQFSCIYVSNKDVYVGGDDRRPSSKGLSASMWKNGNMINLGKDYWWSSVNKIFVKGNDVYCVGNGKKSENGNYVGILWKNGIVIN